MRVRLTVLMLGVFVVGVTLGAGAAYLALRPPLAAVLHPHRAAGRPAGVDALSLGEPVRIAGRWTGAAVIPGQATGVVLSLEAKGIEVGR